MPDRHLIRAVPLCARGRAVLRPAVVAPAVPLSVSWPGLLLGCVLLAGELLVAGGCKRHTDVAATPRQAATAFFQAMVAGDVAAAKAASVGDERSERWLEAMVENTTAMRAFHDAVKERFGAEAGGTSGLSGADAGAKEDEVLAAIQSGEEKVEGDTATITGTADRRKVVHLKRVNGEWKVDRGQLGGTESVDRFVDRTRRTAKAYRDLAAEVRAEKYKSPAEAKQAFGDRLIRAIEEMPPARP
jgi:hypothetical protein